MTAMKDDFYHGGAYLTTKIRKADEKRNGVESVNAPNAPTLPVEVIS